MTDPATFAVRGRWPSDEEMCAVLRDVAGRVDGPVTIPAYQRVRRPGEPAPTTYFHRFGSWADALRAAGLEPPSGRRPIRRWTRDEALDALARWLARTDRPRQIA